MKIEKSKKMEVLTSLLNKLSVEDIEKLKLLMSFMNEGNTQEVVTIRVFAEEYRTLIKNNMSASYLKSVNISLDYLEKFFKPQKVICNINLKDIENFSVYLQQNDKTCKHNKKRNGNGYVVYYRNLKAAFNKAKDWGYVKENYFLKVKLPKKQKTAPAFIHSNQLSAISSQIKEFVVRNVVVIGFYTGMRLNEIVNLKWKNVDLNTLIITVGDEEFITKGKNQRFIPISDEALTAILTQRKSEQAIPIGDSYVFSKSNGQRYTGEYFTKRFKRACKAAGIDKEIHFHSLRHSFASNLVQQGVSLYKVKELLGHASITTTEIYSHLNIDSLRDAIRTLDSPHPSLLLPLKAGQAPGEGPGSLSKTSRLKLIINK